MSGDEGYEWEDPVPGNEEDDGGPVDDTLTLFVSRVPFAWGDEELASTLSVFGEVASASVSWDSRSDRSKGVGFVTYADRAGWNAAQEAGRLKLKKVVHRAVGTLKINLVDRTIGQTRTRPCHMWAKGMCHLGADCAFQHDPELAVDLPTRTEEPKVKKCFAFKKGKCERASDCPFRHDAVSTSEIRLPQDTAAANSDELTAIQAVAAATKGPPNNLVGVCHLWKKKGACRNLDKGRCKYSHPPEVATAAKSKAALQQRKRQREEAAKMRKAAEIAEQALISATHVKCYGLPYTATEAEIRDKFGACGDIAAVDLPLWEDSGRSKGFCTLEFTQAAGASAALALPEDALELGGRWLRVSAGKALRSWEAHGRSQPENCKSVFVGNLPFDIDEATLRATFQDCGKIVEVRLQKEKAFAFVDFSNQRGPEDAVALNGKLLQGRAMRIDYAESSSSSSGSVGEKSKRAKLSERET